MAYKYCAFFGHHDCSTAIRTNLQNTLIHLIEQERVNLFYIGNHGAFDTMVQSILSELMQKYSHITYYIVLACLPKNTASTIPLENSSHTLYPEGIETVPKRFAISWRNRWMIDHSDFVVTYITHPWGNAAQFSTLANQKGKICLNLDLNCT